MAERDKRSDDPDIHRGQDLADRLESGVYDDENTKPKPKSKRKGRNWIFWGLAAWYLLKE